VELLERDGDRTVLEAAIENSRAAGRIAVVVGEAGIGKTALVNTVCGEVAARRVLWGACDPLHTPRPLGPLLDIADAVGHPVPRARPVLPPLIQAAAQRRRSRPGHGF
jgi:predicted ATPase